MRYSEHPHEHYLTDGQGPGDCFLGDVEMWNWIWLVHGMNTTPLYDQSLVGCFSDHQRDLMQMEPLDAAYELAERFEETLPGTINESVFTRAKEAQARLFPPVISHREDNVIHANFRK